MKKFLALFLTLALLAGLTACKDTEAASTAQEQHTVTAPTNDATFVYQPDDPSATLPGGESAFADACCPGNPRDTSVEEIKELYRSLM